MAGIAPIGYRALVRKKTYKLICLYGCNYDGGYLTRPGWELYDSADQAKTREISHRFLKRRLAGLAAGKRGVQTHHGHVD